MEKYDICIIGGGPSGYSAAIRGVDFGKKVCLVEKKNIGGTGIFNGVLTSKTMWELSKNYSIAASVDRGYRVSGIQVDYKAVRKTVIQAAKEKQYQLLSQLETLKKDKKGRGTITYKRGYGSFQSNKILEIIDENGDIELIEAQYFIIATGSRPRQYPGLKVDQKQILDSDGILNLKTFPERMVIIGAGIIGCEFATIFSNFKQTEVHLLDRSFKVIPFEDDDIGDFVSNMLEKNGVKIHHEATLNTIRKHDQYLEVVLDYKDGHRKVIEVDVALISIGREPNLEGLNLKNIGIDYNGGCLNTDQFCKIDKNIYGVGDCVKHANLVNIAEMEGRYAVESIYGDIEYQLNYKNMSTIMFFKPEVAAVGYNEKMLQKLKKSYRVAKYSYSLINRAIAKRLTEGFIKIIVSDDDDQIILGMRASGTHASSLIMSIAFLMDQKSNHYIDVMKTVHPHPSITEGIQECLRVLDNRSIYKPEAFPEYITVKRWSPTKEKY